MLKMRFVISSIMLSFSFCLFWNKVHIRMHFQGQEAPERRTLSAAVTAKPGPSRVKSFGLVTLLGMLCELFISEHHHMRSVSDS